MNMLVMASMVDCLLLTRPDNDHIVSHVLSVVNYYKVYLLQVSMQLGEMSAPSLGRCQWCYQLPLRLLMFVPRGERVR